MAAEIDFEHWVWASQSIRSSESPKRTISICSNSDIDPLFRHKFQEVVQVIDGNGGCPLSSRGQSKSLDI